MTRTQLIRFDSEVTSDWRSMKQHPGDQLYFGRHGQAFWIPYDLVLLIDTQVEEFRGHILAQLEEEYQASLDPD